MKNLRARFQVPVDMSRPRGGRLIEAYSAKLQSSSAGSASSIT